MYQLLKNLNKRQLTIELATLVSSLAISELLYKFGSFTLEAVCFLLTWYLLGSVVHRVVK